MQINIGVQWGMECRFIHGTLVIFFICIGGVKQ